MSASTSNNLSYHEHGGDTLYAGLLNPTMKSYRRNWSRLYWVSVQIRIFNSLIKTHASIDISDPGLLSEGLLENGPHPNSPSSSSSSNSDDEVAVAISIDDITPAEVARIVRERDSNLLQKHGGGERLKLLLESYLEAETDRGSEEEQAAEITTKHAVNVKDFPLFFLEACKSRTNFFLLVSASLSFTTEMMEQEAKYGWHDGVAILAAVFMLVTFRSVANYRRARELQKKLNDMSKLEVSVVRLGQTQTVTISSLVVGDILCLKKGDFVPADGLLVYGNGLELDDKLNPNINNDENPFLFSGSEVIDGEGQMLVTSVGTNTVLGRAHRLVTPDPGEKTLIEAQIDKTNACMENVALITSVVIFGSVLINLVVRKLDKKSNIFPDLKGDVSSCKLIKILQMLFLKPRGKVQILTSALAAVATSLQHGMSFVIAASLLHWRKKMAPKEANVLNLSSCGTIGRVSVICFHLTIEQKHGDIERQELKSAVEALKQAGVCCKMVSKDELPELESMAHELGFFNPASNDMAIEGKDVRTRRTTEASIKKINVMGSCQLGDIIHILQCLKQRGHVVAFIGGMTANDSLALKVADVGITWNKYSTKMTRENSDLVIQSISSLSSVLKIGGCAYRNIQTFTQIQLTASFCGLLITLVTTIVLDESPITGIHLIWVNCIICILGGLMMVMEFQGQELMNNPPAARTESLLTKTMWRNVVIRVVSDAFYLLLFQFIGQAIIHMDEDVVKTMVFHGFTLCQVFNQLAAVGFSRSNAFVVMCSSHWFLVAMGAVMAMQVLLVELLKSLADYARLNVMQWGICYTYAACLCGFGVAVQCIADESCSRSTASRTGFLRTRAWPHVLLISIPFSVFLVGASFSYHVNSLELLTRKF